MEMSRLMAQVDNPSLHRTILSGFAGPYSLGVGKEPATSEPVLILVVPSEAKQAFPGSVTVAGDTVRVLVQRSAMPPVPFAARQPVLMRS